ncbi:hypothetical protein H0S70_01585 [Chryseobacterium manosquense]|uniref:Uncharacterized protein n=1 Tax=Chryseobacterium manosquense TaxID=2754694 RepID=A0A7H1DXK5_9FLAO|nr:hypothetical protein [Chryseobacterium manosquense]QNS41713.1 hypothetical protein H0S70_01585 [Chryseobacterium manosquense]
MARQSSIIKLKGTIGGVTFYKSKDGYLAREKGGVDASRIKNDPAFQRTRENGSEFGRAGNAGKVLRNSIRALLLKASDYRMVSRLTREMVKVIQMDETNPRGQRNIIDGEAELLQGFEFNINGKLGTTLFAPFSVTLDRVTGDAKVDLEAFVPTMAIASPGGTTHFKILSGAMEVDFENQTFNAKISEGNITAWNEVEVTALSLENNLTANSTHPLFFVVGVEFYQQVNGEMYPLKNGAYNALQIVKVVGV